MQRETLAEGLKARQGLLESLRFEQNWKKTVSHCLERSTRKKYPTSLKCESPHLCNSSFSQCVCTMGLGV